MNATNDARTLDCHDMDDIDHALGRPDDPLGEIRKNRMTFLRGGHLARRKLASGHWAAIDPNGKGSTIDLEVTPAGRRALAAWLRQAAA